MDRQLIGTCKKYINIQEGKILKYDCDGETHEITGTIRHFDVYVDMNAPHPSDAVYHVTVTDIDGVGTSEETFYSDWYGDHTGKSDVFEYLDPVDPDDGGKVFMQFSLYKAMEPQEEHYTNVTTSGLDRIEIACGIKKIVAKKPRESYVLQFNTYMAEIWSVKIAPHTEQKECTHVGKKSKRK